MKKLNLPKFESFEDAYDEKCDIVYSTDYINGFEAVIDDEGEFLYGFISKTGYYDDSICKTEDFYIEKRSKGKLKQTYEKVIKQLYKKYKEWVDSLFVKGEGK